MRWVLASGSPRRRELLTQIGISYEVCPSDADENIGSYEAPELVRRLALLKGRSVASQQPDACIISADTVVAAPDGEILGKPKDRSDACRMLRELSGKPHTVYTGVCVLRTDGSRNMVREDCRVCATRVYFRNLSDAEIERYVDSGEPMDKAGAYGIQGRGAVLIERIEGDYFNVMGLPLCTLADMLREAGIGDF